MLFIQVLRQLINIFAYKGYLFDAAIHGEYNGFLSFVIRGQQRHTIEFECLTHQFLAVFFFAITLPKIELSS